MQGSNGDAESENRLVDTTGEGEGGTNTESSTKTYKEPCVKLGSQWKLLYDTGSSNPVLCNNLEQWDVRGGGRDIQEGGNICTPMVDSC